MQRRITLGLLLSKSRLLTTTTSGFADRNLGKTHINATELIVKTSFRESHLRTNLFVESLWGRTIRSSISSPEDRFRAMMFACSQTSVRLVVEATSNSATSCYAKVLQMVVPAL
jgi:hypothetical protein